VLQNDLSITNNPFSSESNEQLSMYSNAISNDMPNINSIRNLDLTILPTLS
jgi:hypothetical protein